MKSVAQVAQLRAAFECYGEMSLALSMMKF